MASIQCKKCKQEVLYKPRANFMIFCPGCFKCIFVECEYGYGPVTPCYIYLGEKEIGIVTKKENEYFLQTQFSTNTLKLKKTYLEALEEAAAIIKENYHIE